MPETAIEYFYLDEMRKRQGPFSDAEIIRLMSNGTIRRDTLVWHAGLTDWHAAGDIEATVALFARIVPPPPPPARAEFGASSGALVADLPVWGLFWRALLVTFGNLVIIPAPWTATALHRFTCEHICLPDGRRFTFAGKPGDIWPVFIANAVLGLIGQSFPTALLVTIPLSGLTAVLVLRWLCTKTGTRDGSVRIRFAGSYWGYVGWYLLIFISCITIIGWAWVLKFLLRWICRHVQGTLAFDFVGTGWSILWRSFAFGFGALLIIPIPWLLRWYITWLISQVQVART